MQTRADFAEAFTRAGFPLIPLAPNSKVPPKDWKNWQRGNVIRDPDAARLHWELNPDQNIAIYTGSHDGGALVAIDIDVKNGKPGLANFRNLQAQCSVPTDTYCQETPTGGAHIVYSSAVAFQSNSDVLAEGLDIRSAAGYIVAAGSVINGKAYTTERIIAPAPIHPSLAEELRQAQEPRDRGVIEKLPGIDPDRAERRVIHYLQHDAPRGVAGSRNNTLAKDVAPICKGLGTDPDVTALLVQEYWPCEPPLEYSEILRTVRSGYKSANDAQGALAPECHFKPEPPDTTAPTVRRNIIDFKAWAAKQPPRLEWIFQDWLSHHPTLLAGAGAMGKTQMMVQTAVSLAVGKAFLGGPAGERRRVLMWACEDDADELHRRIARACEWFQVDMAELAGWLFLDARCGMENELFTLNFNRPVWNTALRDELLAQANDYRADVLILDNIAHVYGAGESVRHDVTTFVNGISGLIKDRPFCPIFCGHPARAAGSEYAGSAAWENACRMRWLLSDRLPDEKDDEADPDSTVRFLCKRKTNYSQKDYIRFTFQNGVLVPAMTVGEIGHVDAVMRERQAETIVIDGLRALKRMGKDCSDSKSSSNYLPKVIAEHKLANGLPKSEIEKAMRAAMVNGRLKRVEVGQYQNRTPKFGLVEVQP